MQYMLLLVRDDAAWESLGDEGQDYAAIMTWWAELAQRGVLRGGGELQPARTATTVRSDGERALIMDGPFMETKETIGGYGIIEVDNLDGAIEIARTWPARHHAVEIRPLVAR